MWRVLCSSVCQLKQLLNCGWGKRWSTVAISNLWAGFGEKHHISVCVGMSEWDKKWLRVEVSESGSDRVWKWVSKWVSEFSYPWGDWLSPRFRGGGGRGGTAVEYVRKEGFPSPRPVFSNVFREVLLLAPPPTPLAGVISCCTQERIFCRSSLQCNEWIQ